MKVQSTCDCILFGNNLNWLNFKVVDLDFPTDHRSIKGKLLTNHKSKSHRSCVSDRKDHGIDLFRNNSSPATSDKLLKELHEARNNAPSLAPEVKSWTSEDSYRLSCLKSRDLRYNNQDEVRRIGREL